MKLEDLNLPLKKDTCYRCRKPKNAFWHAPGCHPDTTPRPHKFASITTDEKRERRREESEALKGCPDPQAFVDAVQKVVEAQKEAEIYVYDGQSYRDIMNRALDKFSEDQALAWLREDKK